MKQARNKLSVTTTSLMISCLGDNTSNLVQRYDPMAEYFWMLEFAQAGEATLQMDMQLNQRWRREIGIPIRHMESYFNLTTNSTTVTQWVKQWSRELSPQRSN